MTIVDTKGNSQARHAFPAYRVYIFGVDVTEDVMNVEVNYNTGRAPNTCSVVLGNELDKYVLTTANFISLFGESDVETQAIQKRKQEIMNTGVGEIAALMAAHQQIGTSDVDDLVIERAKNNNLGELKSKVVVAKVNVRSPGVEAPDIAGKYGGENIRQYTADAYRYPFQAEDPIFHANDPIRIFMRDPFNPRRWYHQFSGYLSNFDDMVDENNQRILTIGGEGPSKLLRYARVTTNPAVLDRQAIIKSRDLNFRSALSEGFSGLTLPEFFFTVLFGNDPDGESGKFTLEESSPAAKQVRSMKIAGVGNFRINGSVVVEYGADTKDPLQLINIPSAGVTDLAQYQSLIDHEVKESDLYDLVAEDTDGNIPVEQQTTVEQLISRAKLDPQTRQIATEEIIRIIGERTDLYPIDGGRLIMLIPSSFQAEINRETLLKDILRSFALNTTSFKSRLGLMYDVTERIEFVFYESPKGDLICEFPLYDFDPDDFGKTEVPHYAMKRKSDGELTPFENISRGPFNDRFTVAKRNTFNFSKGITDEKVRTQVTSYYHPLQGYKSGGTSREFAKPEEVTLDHLIPLYWLRLEQVEPKAYIATREAAKLYAHLTLNKFNADARSLGINAAPNLGLWLNRPIYFEPRNCIGILMGTSHSVTWGTGGSMDSRLNLNYIRGWDGLVDDAGNAVFTTIGGFPGRPLNYKILFRLRDNVDGAAKLPDATG